MFNITPVPKITFDPLGPNDVMLYDSVFNNNATFVKVR